MPRFSTALPVFRVADPDASAAWYAENLGFVPSRQGAQILLRNGGAAIVLVAGEGEKGAACVQVDDVRALYEELRSRAIAAALMTRAPGTTELLVEDPDGYVLVFSETIASVIQPARKQTPPMGVIAPRPRRPVTASE